MSEEIKIKIDAEAKRHYPATNIEIFDPLTINAERAREFEQGIRRSIFSDGAKFGYQLGYEEAMKEHGKVMQYSTPAAAVQNIHVVTMTSESKEPSQDELWQELLKECTTVNHFLAVDTAKKRYRITRL